MANAPVAVSPDVAVHDQWLLLLDGLSQLEVVVVVFVSVAVEGIEAVVQPGSLGRAGYEEMRLL